MKLIVCASFAESLINFRGPLLKEFVSRGHTVFACAPENDPEVIKQLADFGVSYISVRLKRAGTNPRDDLALYNDLQRLFRTLSPDIVLSYTAKPVIYGSLAASAAQVPRIFSIITGLGYAFIGSGWRQRALGTVVRHLYRRSLRYNEKVFFQNPDDRDMFLRLGLVPDAERAVVTNGSGVDTGSFLPVPLPAAPRFLLIGRLLKDKGILEYIEASRALKGKHPSASFSLLGPFDPNPASLSPADLQQMTADSAVCYLGEAKDVRPFLSDCSIYVLPSYREGTPRTVLEAMAMGRPVVTTDVPGCRETVRNGVNGFLVPPRDPRALASAMERFILDPSLVNAMGSEGRRIAVEKYDVNKVNQVILREMGLMS